DFSSCEYEPADTAEEAQIKAAMSRLNRSLNASRERWAAYCGPDFKKRVQAVIRREQNRLVSRLSVPEALAELRAQGRTLDDYAPDTELAACLKNATADGAGGMDLAQVHAACQILMRRPAGDPWAPPPIRLPAH